MSASLIVGILITIGVIALLIAVGLLSSNSRSEVRQPPVVETRPPVREERQVNGARYAQGEQEALAYPRLASPASSASPLSAREPRQDALRQERSQGEAQERYERALEELMALLQQEQRSASSTISSEGQQEDRDPYQPTPRARRRIEDSEPSSRYESGVVSKQLEPEPTVVQAHYSLVPDDEVRKDQPGVLSIPVSIEVDGNLDLERLPPMHIEVVIHIQ